MIKNLIRIVIWKELKGIKDSGGFPTAASLLLLVTKSTSVILLLAGGNALLLKVVVPFLFPSRIVVWHVVVGLVAILEFIKADAADDHQVSVWILIQNACLE